MRWFACNLKRRAKDHKRYLITARCWNSSKKRDWSLLGIITGVLIVDIRDTAALVRFHECFMAPQCVHNSTDFGPFSR
jgi:hypothetical protein